MKITRIETITTPIYPNLLWVQVHTDDGFVRLIVGGFSQRLPKTELPTLH